MKNAERIQAFNQEYSSALERYLASPDEAGLQQAYEIGRKAVTEGLGVLDVANAYQEALVTALFRYFALGDRKQISTAAASFFAESLSSFEMTHRSFREANDSLQRLNEALERRVKERTQELENVNRELNDFAHIVSHDLKAPLSALQSVCELLVAECSDKLDSEDRELLDMLTNCGKRMQRLIDGILQYSKAGRIAEDRLPVNLNKLVQEVLEMLAPPQNIEIEVCPLPTIVCERVRIQQVFQNLLSNAVKYQDKPQGMIRVSCKDTGRHWDFTITDNGRGIPESSLDKIFQLFVSIGGPANGNSTGVGLAVVKKLVEMYGGSIHVESKVGSGSSFSFTLPKAAREAPLVDL